MKKAAEYAFIKTIPILLGYLFLGVAFGLLLQKSGLGALWAFLISSLVYAGSMQFALVGILTGGLSFVTTGVMTLFINSRHAFYGLTFIRRFKEMKLFYPYAAVNDRCGRMPLPRRCHWRIRPSYSTRC